MTRRGYPGTVTAWPKQLRKLVESHGAAAVHRAGLDTLGYPPGLVTTTGEAIEVAKTLSQET